MTPLEQEKLKTEALLDQVWINLEDKLENIIRIAEEKYEIEEKDFIFIKIIFCGVIAEIMLRKGNRLIMENSNDPNGGSTDCRTC